MRQRTSDATRVNATSANSFGGWCNGLKTTGLAHERAKESISWAPRDKAYVGVSLSPAVSVAQISELPILSTCDIDR